MITFVMWGTLIFIIYGFCWFIIHETSEWNKLDRRSMTSDIRSRFNKQNEIELLKRERDALKKQMEQLLDVQPIEASKTVIRRRD